MAIVDPFLQSATLRFPDGDLEISPQLDQYIGLIYDTKRSLVDSNNPEARLEPIVVPEPYRASVVASVVVKYLEGYHPAEAGAVVPAVNDVNVLMTSAIYPECPAWAKHFFSDYTITDLTAALNVAHHLKIPKFTGPCSSFMASEWSNMSFFQIAECFTGTSDPNHPSNVALVAPYRESQAHQHTFEDILFAHDGQNQNELSSSDMSSMSS